jgi:hypothetical protein
VGLNDIGAFDDLNGEQEGPLPYEETELGREDGSIYNLGLAESKIRHQRGMHHLCRMLVLGPDGKITPWSKNMLSRPA